MAFENEPITFEEFMELVKSNNPHANQELIAKAYKFAKKAHAGQLRKSGELFFEHPTETARILINMKADSATICAALLHDTVEDASTSIDAVKKEFGKEVAELVEGMTKIMGQQFPTKEEYKAENLRKILLATTKDTRVILIKLADRLHNMRTLSSFRADKRVRIAKETLEIFAPIAEKLGLWKIKGELEDLSLRYIDYETYKILKEQIHEKRAQREQITHKIVETIRRSLEEKGIKAQVVGRAKYFYSIYKKMLKKQRDFDQIYDLIAIRIVVENITECYKALDIIHTLYVPQLDRFKDYIQHPKANGYQSIHTSVLFGKKVLEIQIRTKEMNYVAEYGVAAHWHYKETEKDKRFDRKIMWLRQILDWLQKSKGARDFVENLKIDLFENEIIVLTPKGDPISLPEKATPVDFAYAVHTRVGDHCSKAMVNNKLEPLDYQLYSGDVVEIVTQNNAKPSRNWLNFVVTSKARSKIRSALGIEVEHRPKKPKEDEEELPKSMIDHIEFSGKTSQLKISKCCEPRLGDPIVGFQTKDGKVTVHKNDCVNIHSLDPDKKVPVSWKTVEEFTRKLRVFVAESPRILAEVLNILVTEKLSVKSVNTRMRKKKVMLTFKIEAKDLSDLDPAVEKIKKLPEVEEVRAD
ncbi:TPA: bifunctional (p)ppGpp synthetase/guanosine-3',5'-bis(diphosphate) 3'-pyrophosphohydrolase [Candidatus Woesearchaeota archaeon]|nr:bifunctional (p)ppGpp synthetase/guanosine-3',5'-bis(diphosphate) 3'-pyrophosphohydrolase [Candidatus Woesearchaeota archaeon]